ncbi:hypothetical protein WMF18_39350 [Sorangium sp. So ce315]|uniref:hypothetical protein n=1 Tax=Sorangium sp. So ce315 TaxID=3133299 RepID=UPI003F5F10FA
MGTEEDRQYYTCRVTMDGESLYCLWYTNGSDGMAADGGRLLLWRSEGAARDHAARRGLHLVHGPGEFAAYDMDLLLGQEIEPSSFPLKDALDAWNLLDDIARTIGHAELVRRSDDAWELHARLSSTVLCHLLNTIPEQFSTGDLGELVSLLRLGKEMVKDRCAVID